MSDHTCDHCGDINPHGGRGWCGSACHAAWKVANPEKAKEWIAVEDLTAVQRAELDGILGLGGKA